MNDVHEVLKEKLIDKKEFESLPVKIRQKLNLLLENLPKKITFFSIRKNFFQNLNSLNNIIREEDLKVKFGINRENVINKFNGYMQSNLEITPKIIAIKNFMEMPKNKSYFKKTRKDKKEFLDFIVAHVKEIKNYFNNVEAYDYDFNANNKMYAVYYRKEYSEGFITRNHGQMLGTSGPKLTLNVFEAFLLPELGMIEIMKEVWGKEVDITAMEVGLKYNKIIQFGNPIDQLNAIQSRIEDSHFKTETINKNLAKKLKFNLYKFFVNIFLRN